MVSDMQVNGVETKKLTPIGIVCEEDRQEKEFDELVKLWVDGKISYESLIENYPDHDSSMLKLFFKSIFRKMY